jgi:hypothetical protein
MNMNNEVILFIIKLVLLNCVEIMTDVKEILNWCQRNINTTYL